LRLGEEAARPVPQDFGEVVVKRLIPVVFKSDDYKAKSGIRRNVNFPSPRSYLSGAWWRPGRAWPQFKRGRDEVIVMPSGFCGHCGILAAPDDTNIVNRLYGQAVMGPVDAESWASRRVHKGP